MSLALEMRHGPAGAQTDHHPDRGNNDAPALSVDTGLAQRPVQNETYHSKSYNPKPQPERQYLFGAQPTFAFKWAHVPVNHDCSKKGINTGDSCSLGRCKDAAIDPTQNDNDQN